MELDIKLEGQERVQRAAGNVRREITSPKLITKAALVVEGQAKQNATGRPGPRVRTGRLRASITHKIINPALARVGTNVFYAPFVEFGHRQQPGQFVPPLQRRLVADFAPAYPFLGPVPEQVKGKLEGVLVEFGKDLGDTWKK